jgi:protein-disulfide isomerase
MSNKLEGIASGVLVIAGIAIAAGVVKRSFFPPPAAVAAATSTKLEFLPSWRDALPIGITVGATSAPVKIVEFADLECPGCRALHSTLEKVLKERSGRVSLTYVSFPLPQHRFALGAARGAECADHLGRFREWANVIFDNQDSLGLKSWADYARDAGISDTAAIQACAIDSKPVPRIEAGIALGQKIHVAFTPTVIVNGWRYPYTPTKADLEAMIDTLQIDKRPVATAAR